MKKLALAVVAIAAFGLSARPAAAQEMAMAEGEDVEFTAQVVDLSCKVVYDLSGEEHRMCSQVCADNGIPLGLITEEGVLYLPVSKSMPGVGSNEELKPHAEHTVKVKGTAIERGGMNTIVIESVEMV